MNASINMKSNKNALLASGSIGAPSYTEKERISLSRRAKKLLKEKNAILVAHYYVDSEIQRLADETGGIVSDSLEMARFGSMQKASTLLVAGVRFMGETAKILNPEKRVIMPTLEAECSLDLSAPTNDFSAFCDQYPEHTVVVYANTSAEVKARADWVVTSSNAIDIVEHLRSKGEKLIWGPDKYLGDYINRETGAQMLLWDGSCVVHEAFKSEALLRLKQKYPSAAILVHPESPYDVIKLADVVGSTSVLINAVKTRYNTEFIVATDNGIFHKMREVAPDKKLIEAPSAGEGATCESCAHCPWMAMNDLHKIVQTLEVGINEIFIEENIRINALRATERMVNFSKR